MNAEDPVFTAAPELLIKHWQESRAYLPLQERSPETWLQAAWLHPPGHPGLELHWSRLKAVKR